MSRAADWVRVRPPRIKFRVYRNGRADRRLVRNLVVLMGKPVSFQKRTRRHACRRTHKATL